ncbi:hypothetical protein FRC07_002251 [Ceratobasidium sp. 392]|nr:hypothetical protein FRC07_002251 [Ceratobasidium sp. 392]
MPVYFEIQTINDNLKEKLEALNIKHKEHAFLIKVGASHTEKTTEVRKDAYKSGQESDQDVTFVPNNELPFKVASLIQDATFEVLQWKPVEGTNETYLIDTDDPDIRKTLEKKIEDWENVHPKDKGWQSVCNWVQGLMEVFKELNLAKDNFDPAESRKDLEELEDEYKLALDKDSEKPESSIQKKNISKLDKVRNQDRWRDRKSKLKGEKDKKDKDNKDEGDS